MGLLLLRSKNYCLQLRVDLELQFSRNPRHWHVAASATVWQSPVPPCAAAREFADFRLDLFFRRLDTCCRELLLHVRCMCSNCFFVVSVGVVMSVTLQFSDRTIHSVWGLVEPVA